MKERGVLFSAPMVRALLDGSKTQTRRIVKPQPDFDTARAIIGASVDDSHAAYDPICASIGLKVGSAFGFVQPNIPCPHGQPGDRLWVREAWRASSAHDDLPPRDIPAGDGVEFGCDPERILTGKLRPSMFMPRWASRITLEITGVRVERLQDISEADALAEGITHSTLNDPRVEYRWLWESINGAGSWDANPFVWVIEFRRVLDATAAAPASSRSAQPGSPKASVGTDRGNPA